MKYSASLLKEGAPTEASLERESATVLSAGVSAADSARTSCAMLKDEPRNRPANIVYNENRFIVSETSALYVFCQENFNLLDIF